MNKFKYRHRSKFESPYLFIQSPKNPSAPLFTYRPFHLTKHVTYFQKGPLHFQEFSEKLSQKKKDRFSLALVYVVSDTFPQDWKNAGYNSGRVIDIDLHNKRLYSYQKTKERWYRQNYTQK